MIFLLRRRRPLVLDVDLVWRRLLAVVVLAIVGVHDFFYRCQLILDRGLLDVVTLGHQLGLESDVVSSVVVWRTLCTLLLCCSVLLELHSWSKDGGSVCCSAVAKLSHTLWRHGRLVHHGLLQARRVQLWQHNRRHLGLLNVVRLYVKSLFLVYMFQAHLVEV